MHMNKVIVAGTRYFNDYDLMCTKLDCLLKHPTNIEIVSGAARGADVLGERYAKEHNIQIKRFPADWDKYGKRAGYIRNNQMADYADYLVAFWDGKSRGTLLMINLAKEKGLKVKVINYETIYSISS